MKIIELTLESCLSSTEFDPSPNRTDPSETPVSERRNLPILYTCDNCSYQLSFGLKDFKKHHESNSSNLNNTDKAIFYAYTNNKKQESFIDFYCPKCKQPTTMFYISGDSGFWGEFFFKIVKIIVLKE